MLNKCGKPGKKYMRNCTINQRKKMTNIFSFTFSGEKSEWLSFLAVSTDNWPDFCTKWNLDRIFIPDANFCFRRRCTLVFKQLNSIAQCQTRHESKTHNKIWDAQIIAKISVFIQVFLFGEPGSRHIFWTKATDDTVWLTANNQLVFFSEDSFGQVQVYFFLFFFGFWKEKKSF